MATWVLDASVVLTWCFEDEANPGCDALLEKLKAEECTTQPIWNSPFERASR